MMITDDRDQHCTPYLRDTKFHRAYADLSISRLLFLITVGKASGTCSDRGL